MSCLKTLTMTQAALGELPLQDAVYVASTNKIYAISGIYVVQLNATTGAVEATVRITSPVNNGARICYHAANDTLYATVWNEPNLGNDNLTHPNKDVYPINPNTMTVGARLDIISNVAFFLVSVDFDTALNPAWGPGWIGSYGDYLYVQWLVDSGWQVIRFDPTNFSDRCNQPSNFGGPFRTEQMAIGPTYVMFADPYDERFYYGPIGWELTNEWDEVDLTGPNYPVACEYCTFDGLFYGVDGNGTLYRIDNPITEAHTIIPIPAGAGVATPDPCRLRWNTYNSLLYLPCMTDNAVVIYNPDTVAWTYKTGFANPVDLVFTPTKVWAVQNSPETPLREVV